MTALTHWKPPHLPYVTMLGPARSALTSSDAERTTRLEGFDVRIGVVVDELAAVLPHGVGRAPFGILVLSD